MAAKKAAPKKAAKKVATKKVAAKNVVTKKATTKKSATKKAAAKRPAAQKAPGGGRADKAEGAGAVQAAIRKLPAEHRVMAERFDALVAREVPEARRAVKWGAPMWGVEGRGWFAAFGSFKSYVKVNFFRGASLKPVPPEGEGKDMRSINIPSLADFDDARMTSWVKQAAAMQGWGK